MKRLVVSRTIRFKEYPDAVDAAQFTVPVPENYDGGVKKSHSVRYCRTQSDVPLSERVKKPVLTGIPLVDTLRENGNSVSGYYFDDDLDIMTDLVTSSSWWGDQITAAVVTKSKLSEETHAFISIELSVVSVSGLFETKVKTDQKRIILKPGVESIFSLKLNFQEYSRLVKSGDLLRASANVHVEEEDYDQYFEKFVGFLPLKITIKIPPALVPDVGEVYLTNQTDELMKKCTVCIGELDNPHRMTIFNGVSLWPGKGVQGRFTLAPKNPSGVYFIEARATCGDRSTSVYAAVPFGAKQTLIPNLPVRIFHPI